VAAFETTKSLYEITRRDTGADIDVFFDCVLRACSCSSGRPSSTLATGATV
jgi:hypothetical protein